MANILVNPGTTTAVATIDIGGGVESPRVNLINQAGVSIYGIAGTPNGTSVIAVQGISGGVPQTVSLAQVNGSTVAVSSGAMDGGTQRVALATNSPGVTATGQTIMSASLPITIASNQQTISVAPDTSVLAVGATGSTLVPKFVALSASALGTNTVVATVSAKRIRVVQWIATTKAAVDFKWQSHGGADLTGLFYSSGAGGGAGGAYNPLGHFQTATAEALDINLSVATTVGGSLVYVEV